MNIFSSPETRRTTIIFDGNGELSPGDEAGLFACHAFGWNSPLSYQLSARAALDRHRGNDLRQTIEVKHNRLAPMANNLISSAATGTALLGNAEEKVLLQNLGLERRLILELNYMAYQIMMHLVEDPTLIKAQPLPRHLSDNPAT